MKFKYSKNRASANLMIAKLVVITHGISFQIIGQNTIWQTIDTNDSLVSESIWLCM